MHAAQTQTRHPGPGGVGDRARLHGMSQSKTVSRSELRLAGALVYLLTCLSSLAGESWPSQPFAMPIHLSRLYSCPHIGANLSILTEPLPDISAGKVFQVPSMGGLFFPARSDLDRFLGPSHAIGPNVRILPSSHVMRAVDSIRSPSVGGRVHDELLGYGFAMFSIQSNARRPDWNQLFHAKPCGRT